MSQLQQDTLSVISDMCSRLGVPMSVDDQRSALWLFLKYTTNLISDTNFPLRVEVEGHPFFIHVMGHDYFSWELFGFHIDNFVADMALYYPANAWLIDWIPLYQAMNLSLRRQVDHLRMMHKNDVKCQMDHNLVFGVPTVALPNVAVG